MNRENINLDLSLSLRYTSPYEPDESNQSQLFESNESDQPQLSSQEFIDNNQSGKFSETWDSNSKLIPYYDFFGPNNNGHGQLVHHLHISAPAAEPPSQQETHIEPEPTQPNPRQARFLPEEGVDNLRAGAGPRLQEIRQLYPWVKSTPTEVHTLNYLLSMNINMISGEIMCKSCKKTKILEYNLMEKFAEVTSYINDNLRQLRHRASEEWMKPELGMCDECGTVTCKPVISPKREEINWLFLVLGQMVGCCSLAQLRYFCDEHDRHSTGAKDRVVYITYVVICNQLDPSLNFEL